MSAGAHQEGLGRFTQDHHWLEARLRVLEGRRAFATRMAESLQAFEAMESAGKLEMDITIATLKANCEEDLIAAHLLVNQAEGALVDAARRTLAACLRARFGVQAATLLEDTLLLDTPEAIIHLLGEALRQRSPEALLGVEARIRAQPAKATAAHVLGGDGAAAEHTERAQA